MAKAAKVALAKFVQPIKSVSSTIAVCVHSLDNSVHFGQNERIIRYAWPYLDNELC